MEPVSGRHAGDVWFDRHLNPDFAETLAAFEGSLPEDYLERDASARRALQESASAPAPAWVNERIAWHDERIMGADGTGGLRVRVYVPRRPARGSRPGVLCIHGGGMWAGTLVSEHAVFARISDRHDAVCVSVDYRLAPEHPYPAAIEDTTAALAWMAGTAGELGVDRDRIAVYGGSAGGGLALGTALHARDHDGPGLCFIQAIYPMIDPASRTASMHQLTRRGAGTWNRSSNIEAWDWYLAGQEPTVYAAPAIAPACALEGLAPVYMDVGELDAFRDENLAFAARLCSAGVPTELHLIPGLFHGAENVVPEAEASRRVLAYREAAMDRALALSR